MLRLPNFDVVTPNTLDDLVAAAARPGARLIAGGTDLLPNLKHRLEAPALLVSLAAVAELRRVYLDAANKQLVVGTGVTLAALANHHEVRASFPSLSKAAGVVASPSIRNAGTIGGNVHLDTRCRYVNQTEFWRSAIGGCLKSEGDVCHVVPGGRNCVAAISSDCVPVLITLDASIVLLGQNGRREVPMAQYYNSDGLAHINKEPHEVATEIRLPLPEFPRRTTYAKWTVRSSIDFPLVSVALRFDLDKDSGDGTIVDARVCIGVLNARPKNLKKAKTLIGNVLSHAQTCDDLCALVYAGSQPLPNIPYDAPYRRKMIPVYTRRALQQLLAT